MVTYTLGSTAHEWSASDAGLARAVVAQWERDRAEQGRVSMTVKAMAERMEAEREAQRLVEAIERAVRAAEEAEIRRYMPEVRAARLANGCW